MTPEVPGSMTRQRSRAAVTGMEIWEGRGWRTEFRTVKFEGPNGSVSGDL